ncbi:MAG TPA: hypothetical protein VKP69_17285 [Isosphaeraceae bacterium]|nr:hypothetical protein [Isosphaeraceae bacterium]
MSGIPHGTPVRRIERRPDILAGQFEWEVLRACEGAPGDQERVARAFPNTNRNRTDGTLLSYFAAGWRGADRGSAP